MHLDCTGNSRNGKTSKDHSKNVGNEKTGFSAEAFVDDLLNNASKTPCDQTTDHFNAEGLPEFYNADKFKMGQLFFQKHIFAIYLCKFLGLVVTLSSPSVLAILQMTKMSGCNMTAYRRYVATLLHMNIWYECEISPNSRLMKSIRKVKAMHNSASMKSRGSERPPITQLDMVLTQFGFMGFAIVRAEQMGIHKATKEEQEGFIHFWKVIASLMGVQDRFNICRDSLEETKEICEALIDRAFNPFVKRKDENFLKMTRYMMEGLWHVFPSLNVHVFLTYLYDNLKPRVNMNNNDSEKYFDLSFIERFYYAYICITLNSLKYDIVRIILNRLHHLTIWIIERYPFLAVYAFGYKNAMVSIESNHVTSG